MCFSFSCCNASTGSRFRGVRVVEGLERTVSAEVVQKILRSSLEATLGGSESATTMRLSHIEASIWPTYQALPKNSMGRLSPRAVRHAVHNYFAKEHGWLIQGLEPHGHQQEVKDVHAVSILQDKAPALVEALLEAKRVDHSLSLEDVVAMTAALEKLIVDESISLLESSYTLNRVSTAEEIDEHALHEVLTSYLLLFEMGVRGNHTDIARHQAIKAKVAAAGGSWPTLVEFEQDAVSNFDYKRKDRTNPFIPSARFSFEASAQIVEGLTHGYGKWQNTECRQMKDELMSLDPEGSGRVPLSAFYSQPETADYQFTESIDYLREIGALDEAEGHAPHVRIANYMAGPSNCIASSSYYSICCLSDCDALMSDLEGHVRGPTAAPETLLGLASNLTSTSIDTPRVISDDLRAKLHRVADRHGGEVPLHGRLFAQWMHFAFPSECPFPHITDSVTVLTPSHWTDGRKASAPADERQRHIEAGTKMTSPAAMPTLEWSDDEVLPLLEPQKQGRSALGGAMRVMMQMALLMVLGRIIVSGMRTAANAAGVGRGKEKDDRLTLPLRL